MEAQLEHLFQSASWRIWITDRYGVGGRLRVAQTAQRIEDETADGAGEYPQRGWEWVEIDDGHTYPAPTMTISEDWFAAIVAAGNSERGVMPPNTSQANHLADAISIRDRLLTLVERESS